MKKNSDISNKKKIKSMQMKKIQIKNKISIKEIKRKIPFFIKRMMKV